MVILMSVLRSKPVEKIRLTKYNHVRKTLEIDIFNAGNLIQYPHEHVRTDSPVIGK